MAKPSKKVLKSKLEEEKKKNKTEFNVNFESEEYLNLKKSMEEALKKEKEEHSKILEKHKESTQIQKEPTQEEIEQENIRKAQEYIAETKRLNEEVSTKRIYEQPKELLEIDLFNNYNDKHMVHRLREIEKTNSQAGDFRVKKYLQVNSLPQKPKTAKLETLEQVQTMLSSSKKEIFDRSGKTKVLKKMKLTKEQKIIFEKMFLDKVKLQAKMLMMFQPTGSKIPMYELYWLIQNEIVALQKIYKTSKNVMNLSEFEFCDALVWSCRYLIEMLYTEEYPFEFIQKDCLELSKNIFRELKTEKDTINYFDAEKASLRIVKEMFLKYKYSMMVVSMPND